MPSPAETPVTRILLPVRLIPDSATISAISEGVRAYALDPANAEALWKKSEEMVGETF